MKKETIIWLTENYPPQRGGMSNSCDRIIRGLRNRGFYIHIVHFTNRERPYTVEEQINGAYTAVPFEDSEPHILNRTWLVLRKIKDVGMVVCFGGHLSLIGAPVFARWLDVPLITMVRGNDFDVSIFSHRKRKVMEDAYTASERIVSVSAEKTWKIRKSFPGAKVVAIPNGLESDEWMPTSGEEEFAVQWRSERNIDGNEKLCIGMFGQLKAKKGGEFLLRSLEGFEITSRLHFLLIGEVEEETREFLDQGFSYDLLPFLDRYELMRYYLCCDAVAIPSFYDGMPNVLLESGGLGIPVIASDVDGMKDVIVDNRSGILFEAGDMTACRKALYDFAELTPEGREELGKNLQNVITENYSLTNEIDNYERVFHEVLGVGPDHRIVQWGGEESSGR